MLYIAFARNIKSRFFFILVKNESVSYLYRIMKKVTICQSKVEHTAYYACEWWDWMYHRTNSKRKIINAIAIHMAYLV